MTVKEISRRTGISVRTLHYYDEIGLLKPAEVTAAGYRIYNDASLERLQQILLFRELQFPLSDIAKILNSPSFDRTRALEQQLHLLQLKKERLENLIIVAENILTEGAKIMDFRAFDTSKIDEYVEETKASWGKTEAYHEYEEKTRAYDKSDWRQAEAALLDAFRAFGKLRLTAPDGVEAQAQVGILQDTITAHFYTCTNEILAGLGQMYTEDPRFAENIDAAGGEGTAVFAARAIAIYCAAKRN